MLELTPEALRHAVEAMGYGAAGLGFLAGLAFSVNPVAVAAIPVALAYLSQALGRGWGLLLGPLLIALGLIWLGWLKLPLPALALRGKRPTGAWGAFALGVPFSLAVCPVCTPTLLALLGVVAVLGSPGLGAVILLAFALGRAIPILLGAWALGWLDALRALHRWRRAFDRVAGLTLVATGLYLLNAYFAVIPALAA